MASFHFTRMDSSLFTLHSSLKSLWSRLLAAFSFFTRLPFWRLGHIQPEHYKRVVALWPLVGWFTGAVTVLVFLLAHAVMPCAFSLLLAFTVRVLLTGALHEDGLADFFDGFGGGTTRERTLEIMKDSHIGTYGVLGLVIYFLMLFWVGYNIIVCTEFVYGIGFVCYALFAADTFGKWAASQIVNFLPYARTAEQAKNKFVYERMSVGEVLVGALFGWAPTLLFFQFAAGLVAVAAMVAAGLMMLLMWRRLKGYTGDCCGATMLISELVYLIVMGALVCSH